MNQREQTLNALKSGISSSQLTYGADFVATSLERLEQTLKDNPQKLVFALIPSPITQNLAKNMNVLALLDENPVEGSNVLDHLARNCHLQINNAIGAGATGFCYVINGANPQTCSPMQYGGFFLERDREILAQHSDSLSIVVVSGATEPYIDFVSDLPANVFTWDSGSGWTTSQIKNLRNGLLMSQSTDSDIQISTEQLNSLTNFQEATATI